MTSYWDVASTSHHRVTLPTHMVAPPNQINPPATLSSNRGVTNPPHPLSQQGVLSSSARRTSLHGGSRVNDNTSIRYSPHFLSQSCILADRNVERPPFPLPGFVWFVGQNIECTVPSPKATLFLTSAALSDNKETYWSRERLKPWGVHKTARSAHDGPPEHSDFFSSVTNGKATLESQQSFARSGFE